VFGAVARLFERYADAHYRVDVSGAPIHSPDGSLIGRIEVLRRRWRRIEVEGWCTLPDIRLDPGLGPPIVARRHARPTEVDAVDCVARPGFSCAALAEPGRAALIVGGTDAPLRLPLTDLTPGTRLLGTLRLIPGFAAALLSVSPHLLRWLLHRDPEARAAVGRAFREGGEEEAVWLPDDLLAVEGPGPSALPTAACWPVTIILPVFNAFDLLGNCLQRVEENTDTPWHLIIVHDASTDPLVGPFLRGWAAARPDRVTLLEQPKNLGFVAATNRGLAEAAKHGGHVVLLNSDANVPPRWASRLLAPFDGHPEVASVTPMSNDAELLTVPRMSRRIDLRGGAADRIDAAAQKIAAGVSLAEMPTGVGFCMALAPAWLARVPAFDRSFGRGYGEEVDWCQKTRALGARHLGHAGLFVEHWGGASFGSEKLRHVQDAARVISQRYPRFDTEVQRFLASDPLAAPRLALAVAWAGVAGEGAVPVYLAHSLGGGAELWLQKRVRADVEGPAGAALVIRVGGRARWRVEVHGPWGESAGQSDSGDLIVRLLALAGERHAIYSCGVGDIDPVSLPGWLLRFAGEGATVSVLFHDYLPLSPSYTLLDADGCYRGVPRDDRTDPAHRAPGSDGATVPLSAWRSAWKPLLDAAAFRGNS
jgi:O-antigen biosynthesis protein